MKNQGTSWFRTTSGICSCNPIPAVTSQDGVRSMEVVGVPSYSIHSRKRTFHTTPSCDCWCNPIYTSITKSSTHSCRPPTPRLLSSEAAGARGGRAVRLLRLRGRRSGRDVGRRVGRLEGPPERRREVRQAELREREAQSEAFRGFEESVPVPLHLQSYLLRSDWTLLAPTPNIFSEGLGGLAHRVQVPPEDGLGGESTSREWSWGVKGHPQDGAGPLG